METFPAESLTGEFKKQLEDFEPAPTQTEKGKTQTSVAEELKIEEELPN